MIRIIAALLLISSAGFAQTIPSPAASNSLLPGPCVAPACIDFTVTLPGLKADGVTKPIADASGQTSTDRDQDPLCHKCKALTLSEAVTRSLLAALPGDHPAPSQAQPNPTMTRDQTAQMNARATLADKIADNPRAELSDDERLVICHRAETYWGGIVPRRVLQRVCPKDDDLTTPVRAIAP